MVHLLKHRHSSRHGKRIMWCILDVLVAWSSSIRRAPPGTCYSACLGVAKATFVSNIDVDMCLMIHSMWGT